MKGRDENETRTGARMLESKKIGPPALAQSTGHDAIYVGVAPVLPNQLLLTSACKVHTWWYARSFSLIYTLKKKKKKQSIGQ